MASAWEARKIDYPEAADIINAGLDKYWNHAELVLRSRHVYIAYYFFFHCQALANFFLIITPSMKLERYTDILLTLIFINSQLQPYHTELAGPLLDHNTGAYGGMFN